MILWSEEVLKFCHSLVYKCWEQRAPLTFAGRLNSGSAMEKEKDCRECWLKASHTD